MNQHGTPPLVTIGMPVYNEKRFIAEAIQSVLDQTCTDFELLISDDASTDGTAEICADLAARDARIRFVRQDTNLGPFLNLKFVTDQARSPFLVWLAQDDKLAPGYLEECLQQLNPSPQTVLVSSDFEIIDEAGRPICTEFLESIRAAIPWRVRRAEFFRFPVYSNIFYGFYGMMRTQACQKMFSELKKPRYMSQIELPVMARLATMGEIFSFARVLRYYRRVGTSLYHTERNSLREKSRFRQFAIQARHFAGLIADQVAVLLHSPLPGAAKCGILARLAYFYCVRCVVLVARGKPPGH
jgi:glycosyltransferase involved in cell wall biosynthesis